jgi:hypothetical protein
LTESLGLDYRFVLDLRRPQAGDAARLKLDPDRGNPLAARSRFEQTAAHRRLGAELLERGLQLPPANIIRQIAE